MTPSAKRTHTTASVTKTASPCLPRSRRMTPHATATKTTASYRGTTCSKPTATAYAAASAHADASFVISEALRAVARGSPRSSVGDLRRRRQVQADSEEDHLVELEGPIFLVDLVVGELAVGRRAL